MTAKNKKAQAGGHIIEIILVVALVAVIATLIYLFIIKPDATSINKCESKQLPYKTVCKTDCDTGETETGIHPCPEGSVCCIQLQEE